MQDRPAPIVAALSGQAAAALLLFVCCAPALAAGSKLLCEETASSTISRDVVVEELGVENIDRGIAVAPANGELLLSASNDFDAQGLNVSMAPQVETILREIFDESLPEDYEATTATPVPAPGAATLFELAAPVLREKSRHIDDSDIRNAESDVTGVISGVPADDDLSRFRRHMLRTDI